MSHAASERIANPAATRRTLPARRAPDLTAAAPCPRLRRPPTTQIIMLAITSAFSTTYTGLATSKLSQSRVTRAGCVEMKKASVGDLSDAELKGKRVRNCPPALLARALLVASAHRPLLASAHRARAPSGRSWCAAT